ncbi:insulinase family protein, partial [Pseudomonas aeruginosa]
RHESADRPKSIIEIAHNQILLDEPQSDESFLNEIDKVTKDDITKLANEAVLDTIYVLTKGGNE